MHVKQNCKGFRAICNENMQWNVWKNISMLKIRCECYHYCKHCINIDNDTCEVCFKGVNDTDEACLTMPTTPAKFLTIFGLPLACIYDISKVSFVLSWHASLVSCTPVWHAHLVSLTGVRNLSAGIIDFDKAIKTSDCCNFQCSWYKSGLPLQQQRS